MLMLQYYTMTFQKNFLINTRPFQMLKKESWTINMILLIYFLKHNYNIWFENKKESTDKEKLIDKEELINKAESTDVPPIPPLESDEEEEKEKEKKF